LVDEQADFDIFKSQKKKNSSLNFLVGIFKTNTCLTSALSEVNHLSHFNLKKRTFLRSRLHLINENLEKASVYLPSRINLDRSFVKSSRQKGLIVIEKCLLCVLLTIVNLDFGKIIVFFSSKLNFIK
jgi:hypothetical protein